MLITGKLYDWKTPFNDVSVAKINAAWAKEYGENAEIALIYKDGIFTGMMSVLNGRTLEEIVAQHTTYFNKPATPETPI